MEDIKRMWVKYSQEGGYSHDEHVAFAKALETHGKLPSSFMLFPAVSRNKDIWTDIARMRTLNTEQARAGAEKHVCPLQLDIIKRLIKRYSNEGEVVYDPFNGIGSTVYQAILQGRIGWGTELNPEYWRYSIGYAESAQINAASPTLFDIAKEMEAMK
jgi:DNA modification methylase